MSIFKKKFDTLNLLEHFDYVKLLKIKVDKKLSFYDDKIFFSTIAFLFVSLLGSAWFHNFWILSAFFLIGISVISIGFSSFMKNKVKHYYSNKLGVTYHYNDIMNTLKNVDNQKKIIEYFNEAIGQDNNLKLMNENFKLLLQQENYDSAIEYIKSIVSQINYQKICKEEIKEKQIANYEYEKKLGVENIKSRENEVELEFGSNLKKYL